jgi:uncharacterized protein YbbC (DUF1343 family)
MTTTKPGSGVTTGLERLLARACPHLRGDRLGLIAHPASVTSDLVHAADALLASGFDLRVLFGPQHGVRGDKQENMIESDHFVDNRTGLPVHSLYSEVRKPTLAMLRGLDALLFDLQDVGVRVYTYAWTMALAMEACREAGVRFVVLDRPNPIGGVLVEGPLLRAGFESFVGLHPIPLRHGLTAGELARWLNAERSIGCELEVLDCDGWQRTRWGNETGLPWVLPSPNLPTLDSCAAYPGMVLLEGTNLSEGRGTTRPFEIFGTPYLEPHVLTEALEARGLPGVQFRPCWFEPTFHKYAGALCGGAQIHVADRHAFRPVETAVAILRTARDQTPDRFRWRDPPYEYEIEKMPIDILWGSDRLRSEIDAGAEVDEILAGVEDELSTWSRETAEYRVYD